MAAQINSNTPFNGIAARTPVYLPKGAAYHCTAHTVFRLTIKYLRYSLNSLGIGRIYDIMIAKGRWARAMRGCSINKLILIITCEKTGYTDMLFTLLSSYNYVSLPLSIKHFAVRIYLAGCVCICVPDWTHSRRTYGNFTENSYLYSRDMLLVGVSVSCFPSVHECRVSWVSFLFACVAVFFLRRV